MDIKRSGSQPSTKGSAEYFIGTVRIDPLFEALDRARTLGASVTFEQACSNIIAIGKIDAGVGAFNVPGSVKATVEPIK